MDTFEPGTSKQFTFQSSVSPDAAPRFCVYNSSGTLIDSLTSINSGGNNYYAMTTMPASADGIYLFEWYTTSTISTGSAYPFYVRGLYNVVRTKQGG